MNQAASHLANRKELYRGAEKERFLQTEVGGKWKFVAKNGNFRLS